MADLNQVLAMLEKDQQSVDKNRIPSSNLMNLAVSLSKVQGSQHVNLANTIYSHAIAESDPVKVKQYMASITDLADKSPDVYQTYITGLLPIIQTAHDNLLKDKVFADRMNKIMRTHRAGGEVTDLPDVINQLMTLKQEESKNMSAASYASIQANLTTFQSEVSLVELFNYYNQQTTPSTPELEAPVGATEVQKTVFGLLETQRRSYKGGGDPADILREVKSLSGRSITVSEDRDRRSLYTRATKQALKYVSEHGYEAFKGALEDGTVGYRDTNGMVIDLPTLQGFDQTGNFGTRVEGDSLTMAYRLAQNIYLREGKDQQRDAFFAKLEGLHTVSMDLFLQIPEDQRTDNEISIIKSMPSVKGFGSMAKSRLGQADIVGLINRYDQALVWLMREEFGEPFKGKNLFRTTYSGEDVPDLTQEVSDPRRIRAMDLWIKQGHLEAKGEAKGEGSGVFGSGRSTSDRVSQYFYNTVEARKMIYDVFNSGLFDDSSTGEIYNFNQGGISSSPFIYNDD